MRAVRRHLGLAWPSLGLLGSASVAAAATNLLSHRPIHWWWHLPLLQGHSASWHLFWAGVVLLAVAWLGLGRRIARAGAADCRPRDVVLVGVLWALPLALGPALFSLDMYSYLAQGSILHHGLNPYRTPPAALAGLHQPGLLSAVSTNWRHTTAPYGPLFVWLASLVAAVAGGHLALGVTLMRLPELAGLGLLAVFVPRLARALGADPVRAVWLALVSPLTLLYLVGGGHNDALMAGLLVAGVTLAVEHRPLAAIALCALATSVKLPAAAGIVVIGLCWIREDRGRFRERLTRVLALGTAVSGGVVLATGLLAGVGVSWISGGLLSTPQASRLALTPATAAAVSLYTVARGGAHAGVAHAARALESGAGTVAMVLTAAFVLWLCWKVRTASLARYMGLILLAATLGGPAAWPWYLSWSLGLLAADRIAQRSRWLPLVAVAAAFPVMAGGQVAIALPEAPRMLAVYVLAAAIATGAWIRRRHGPLVRLNALRLVRPPGRPEAAG